jgi:hypothetical protein
MPIAGISQGLGIGGGTSATSSGAPGGGAPFIPNGRSLLFDGTNDYATFDSEIVFSGVYTVSFWLKPSAQNWGNIFYGTGNDYVDIYGTTSGGTSYGNKINVRNMGTVTSAVDSVPVGVWRNVLVIRDSSNVVKIYVQGTHSGGTGSFAGDSHFSKVADGGSGEFTGYIDEIAFWNSDQTSNAAAIYNSGVAGDLNDVSPPLHWYRMGDVNGGSGTTIDDIGTAANNPLTLINGPIYTTEVPS